MNQLQQPTLKDAAKSYAIYMRAAKIAPRSYWASVRVLAHVVTFYGGDFPLANFTGDRMLQYLDVYSPFSEDPYDRVRGQVLWMFANWMKKNELVPTWTAPVKK